jgi:hypothetical protein
MRVESSVTAISWIPSDAIEGMPKLPFELGVAHYDAPPPDHVEKGDLERLRADATLARLLKRDPYYEKQDKVIIASGLLLYHRGKFAEAYDNFAVLKSTQALYYQCKSLEQMQKYIQALVVLNSC